MTLLRPYQQTAIDAIRDSYANRRRAPLLVMPTGAGKTVAFSYIAANAAAKQKRVTILAHRAELLDQISEALTRESVTHGFIAAGHSATDHPVQVASVQTLVRRTSRITAPDLIICDEAHHATASNSYGKILAAYPQARRLGVTATPCRLSGEALGDVFDDLILGPSVAELTEQGYLTPARIFAPPTVDVSGLHTRAGEFVASEVAERVQKPSVTGSAVDHYRQHAHGLAAVCFCHSIEHSQYMAEAFRQAGYVAAHLDGNTPREIRRAMVNDLRAGTLHVLCSVDVVSEGFDAPGIHCGILLRPTASESLYLQQIGRCLRPAPGKSAAIILDHVGSTLRHGLPSDDREWTLTGKQASHRKKRDADDLPVRVCLRCFAAQRPAPACRQCGTPFPVKSRQVDERAGQLRELTADELAARRVRRDARRQVGRAQTLEDLQEIEKARGYKPGWARHVFEAKKRKQENVNGTDGRIGAEGN